MAPFSYSWLVNNSPVNNGSPYPQELLYQNTGSNFTIEVRVTDAIGANGNKTKSVTISPSAPLCQY
ncbi:MAG: hypothetical protein ACT4PM_01705 [Gemmatimonadales bacterium]